MYKIKAKLDFVNVQNQGEKQEFLDSDLYQPPSSTSNILIRSFTVMYKN